MEQFTIGELIALLQEAGEQDELANVDIAVGDADTSFDQLGFDSLTLLNVVTQLESKYGISVGFAALTDARTPNELLGLIHGQFQDNRKIA